MIRMLALACLTLSVVGQAEAPPDCSQMSPAECNAATRSWGQRLDERMATAPTRVGWQSECQKDRVTLQNKCTLSHGKLQVLRTEQLGVCFAGPSNTHPGMQAVIRIGTFEPIRYEGSIVCGQKAVDIIAQMMTEQPGAARGHKWPNQIDEFEFQTTGFKSAFKEFEQLVKANP